MMSPNANKKLRIAILDLYEGEENQGMRCIREILRHWGDTHDILFTYDEFDVRGKFDLPSIDYDIYISSGGPGSPFGSEGTVWETKYFQWLAQVEAWNLAVEHKTKKYVFLICHSFQLVSRYYQVGNLCKRKSTSFGVFPIHLLPAGQDEIIFKGLSNPFYAVDSRDYQLIAPNQARIDEMGITILALEKERPHLPFERAIMALRFNPYMVGTQFHPEADEMGMQMYLQRADKRNHITEQYGEEKWKSMLDQLQDHDKIRLTHQQILPNFLDAALAYL